GPSAVRTTAAPGSTGRTRPALDPSLRAPSCGASLDQRNRTDGLGATGGKSRVLECVVGDVVVTTVVAVGGEDGDGDVVAARVRKRVQHLRRVIAGVGVGDVALMSPGPAALDLDLCA